MPPPRNTAQGGIGEDAHMFFQRRLFTCRHPSRYAAGVVQQVTNGYGFGNGVVANPEPGQISDHRRIQIELPRLHELHYSQRGERLAHGPQKKSGVRFHRRASRTRFTKASNVEDRVAVNNGQSHPRHPVPLHHALDIDLDAVDSLGIEAPSRRSRRVFWGQKEASQ